MKFNLTAKASLPVLYPDFTVETGLIRYLGQPCYPISTQMSALLQQCDGQHTLTELDAIFEGDLATALDILTSLGVLYLSEGQNSINSDPRIWVLSPHMDDAFLSIGGAISQWAGVQVQNVFGDDPWIVDKRQKVTAAEMIMYRRKEEVFNAQVAGCQIDFWEFPSQPYRGYGVWNAPVDWERDQGLQNELEKQIMIALEKFPYEKVLIPLGVGSNTDHRLLSDLAMEMADRGAFGGAQVGFYEDLPYACEPKNWADTWFTLQKILQRSACEFINVTAVQEKKWHLLQTYRSQLGPSLAYRIWQYAHPAQMHTLDGALPLPDNATPDHYYERLWWLKT